MLVIIASQNDQLAQTLAERWKDRDARIMTSQDLSTAGWRYYDDDSAATRIVVGNSVVDAREVTGVLTRVPWIMESELSHITPGDRNYVGTEMSAFLVAWLSKAPFPVINRPTPTCLLGPSWAREMWACHASRCGMRIPAANRLADLSQSAKEKPGTSPVTAVTVIGGRSIGPAAPKLAAQAGRLAEAARVELLTVAFSSPDEDAEFAGAYLDADVSRPEIADALLDRFQQRAARPA